MSGPADDMTPATYITRHAADLRRCVAELVGIPTVNPPGENYDAITGLLTRKLDALGL
jgi:succinyl-diaminopimelate desuccinylase